MRDEKAIGLPNWKRALMRWSSVREEDDSADEFRDYPGQEGLWASLFGRNKEELVSTLKRYPQLIDEEFICRTTRGKRLRSGRLAHVVVDMGWRGALDVLWEAGDRFDLPASSKQSSGPNRSHTVFEQMIFDGNAPMLNRMLRIGIDVNGIAGEPAIEILLCGNRPRYTDTQIGKILAKSNLDPWLPCSSSPPTPILVKLLEEMRTHFVLPVLCEIEVVPPQFAPMLTQAWAKSWHHVFTNNASFEDIYGILSELARLNCPLPQLHEIMVLAVPVKDQFNDRCELHSKMMHAVHANQLFEVRDWEEVELAASKVEYQGCESWKSLFSKDVLMNSSRQAPTSKRARARL